jgi:hypothetical protein
MKQFHFLIIRPAKTGIYYQEFQKGGEKALSLTLMSIRDPLPLREAKPVTTEWSSSGILSVSQCSSQRYIYAETHYSLGTIILCPLRAFAAETLVG